VQHVRSFEVQVNADCIVRHDGIFFRICSRWISRWWCGQDDRLCLGDDKRWRSVAVVTFQRSRFVVARVNAVRSSHRRTCVRPGPVPPPPTTAMTAGFAALPPVLDDSAAVTVRRREASVVGGHQLLTTGSFPLYILPWMMTTTTIQLESVTQLARNSNTKMVIWWSSSLRQWCSRTNRTCVGNSNIKSKDDSAAVRQLASESSTLTWWVPVHLEGHRRYSWLTGSDMSVSETSLLKRCQTTPRATVLYIKLLSALFRTFGVYTQWTIKNVTFYFWL